MRKIIEKWTEFRQNPWTKYYLQTIGVFIKLFTLMAILSYIFNNWVFAIVSSLIFCNMQKYTYNFHFKNMWRCCFMSNILIVLFGFMAKYSVEYIWVVCIFSLYCIRNIFSKMPLIDMDLAYKKRWYNRKYFRKVLQFFKINTKKWDIPYDKEYCQKHFGVFVFILSIIILFCLYFGYIYLINCIFWSIIILDLLFFVNETKW